MTKQNTFIDIGMNKTTIESIQADIANGTAKGTLKDYADKHRDIVKKAHKLGFKKHTKSPCSSCGHVICRCKDRKARQKLEEKQRAENIHENNE